MYPLPAVTIFKNPDLAISANHQYTPVFECVPVSLDNINTTFPTPKDEDYYMFESSPQSSNNGQMTPLSPCSVSDQHNLTFIYNNSVVAEMSAASDSFALSNHKTPLVTHYASNNAIKADNPKQNSFVTTEYTNLVSNTFSNEAIINQPAMMTAYHDDKAVSEKPIKEEADHVQEKSSTKQDGVFTPTNFKHMSREQLIARLLVLENEKSSSNNNSKSQQQPVITRCRWKGCTKKFDILKKLISHLTEVHVGGGKPSYQCEWEDCPREDHPFSKRHKMHNHLRTHTGERPFTCTKPDCKKKFSRLDSLTTHLKTHSNVRPYVCLSAGCGKAYYHSRSLKKHEKIHELTTPSSPERRNLDSAMAIPSTSNMIPQHQQQHFIPYNQFMYGEKMSLVDTSSYNAFV